MTYRVLTSISLALSLCLTSAACTAQTSHPKLIVVVTVDQLRGDLIQRYAPAFTGGLKRMLDEGYRFENGSHAHAITHTAAGHASISTGTFPSRSGIVANSWQQREGDTWTPMYAVEDPESPILGVEGAPGRSPRNLLRDGLADWVLSADPSAQVVSLSAKDRSAVTMAGRSRGQVYWTVPQVGRFV
ncbi:MAG: alkaline phosphatase family protein, partial [Gemmatimonadota bacterium]|nr:alkaline phosphatase family protein [Gemmatimonadota bacterium]